MSRKQSIALIGGQVAGQLALLAAVPVYSRLVAVGEVGIYQIATAVALLLQPMATMRMEFLIPGAETLGQARGRVRAARVVCSSVAVLCVVVGFGAYALHFEAGMGTALGAGIILLASGLTVLDNSILIWLGDLKRLALRNLLSGFFAALLQVLAAVYWKSAIALALAMLIGRLAAILVVPKQLAGHDQLIPRGSLFGEIVWRDAIPVVAAGTITAGGMQTLLLVSGAVFGQVGAAQLGMAQRIAGVPTTFLAQGLTQVITAKASAIIRSERAVLAGFLRARIRLLLCASTLCAIGMAVVGPMLAVPVLGEEWQVAGTLIAVLAAPLSLLLAMSPVMPVLALIQENSLLLWLNVVRFLAILTSTVIAGFVTRDLVITSLITAVVWASCYLASLFALQLAAKRWDSRQIASESGSESSVS